MNTHLVSTTDLQRNCKKILISLHHSELPFVVLRDSQPAGVLLRFEEYQRLLALEKSMLRTRMEKILSQFETKHAHVSDSQLDRDIEQARYATRSR